MQIVLTNKNTLIFDEFKFKCVIGKKGITSKKKEGDLKTPKGLFSLGPLYFRKDRINNLETNLKKIPIKKNMVWCDDSSSNFYNKLTKKNKKFSYEKMFRKDNLYDLVVVINYNTKKVIKNKGNNFLENLNMRIKNSDKEISSLYEEIFL